MRRRWGVSAIERTRIATGAIAGSIMAPIIGTHISRKGTSGMPMVPGASPIMDASASVRRHASAAMMSNAIQPGSASRAAVFISCTPPRR
jgi:hypothetical protein